MRGLIFGAHPAGAPVTSNVRARAMHGRHSAIIAISLLVCACGSNKQTIALSADAGNFNVRTLGPTTSTAALSVSMRLTAFNGGEPA